MERADSWDNDRLPAPPKKCQEESVLFAGDRCGTQRWKPPGETCAAKKKVKVNWTRVVSRPINGTRTATFDAESTKP